MRKSFSDKINYDIQAFYNDSLTLLQDYQKDFVDYYSQDGAYPKSAFDLLDKLVYQSQLIYQKVAINRDSFDNYSDFLVFDQIEDFLSTFRSIQNYSRWYHSSTIKGRFKTTTEINYSLRQNQTLENFSTEIGWTNQEQGALELALRNRIKETDYDLKGGLQFKFAYQNNQALELQTVIDEMTGENLLGKDIKKKFSLSNDDLVVLSPRATFLQTCEILSNLMKNSNPEFPVDGFDKSAISNKNIMKARLSTFIRQIYTVISKDDTISSFAVTNIGTEGDTLRIELEFKSHLSDELEKTSVYGN